MGKYHFNRHTWDALLEPSYLVTGRKVCRCVVLNYSVSSAKQAIQKVIWAIEALNLLGTGLTKVSILLFVNQMMRRNLATPIATILWATVAFVVFSTVTFEISLFSECRPFSAFRMQVDIGYAYGGAKWHCVNEGAKLLSAGIISTVQDFIVTTLPLVLIWDLQMAQKKKFAIIAVFAVGYL